MNVGAIHNPAVLLRKGARNNSRGFYVVLGCDGAGKTAVLHALTQLDRFTLRPEDVFHWLPRYRSDWHAAPPVPWPHSQKPRGVVSSFLKLIYLLGAFHLGFWTQVRPRIQRGRTVMFDRYYHDMLIDPERYRYGGPAWLSKIAGTLLPKPRAWLLIDVPVEVLILRKTELPIEELRPLRDGYLRFVRAQPNGFVIDGTKPLNEVAGDIARHVNAVRHALGD